MGSRLRSIAASATRPALALSLASLASVPCRQAAGETPARVGSSRPRLCFPAAWRLMEIVDVSLCLFPFLSRAVSDPF